MLANKPHYNLASNICGEITLWTLNPIMLLVANLADTE